MSREIVVIKRAELQPGTPREFRFLSREEKEDLDRAKRGENIRLPTLGSNNRKQRKT